MRPSKPPRCLLALKYIEVSQEAVGIPSEFDFTTYELRCPDCGCDKLQVFAPMIEENVPNSPIEVRCAECHLSAQLFDRNRDGYDAEVEECGDAEDKGPLNFWACSACGRSSGKLFASFGYQYAVDEGEVPDQIQNFFDAFILTHICEETKRPSVVAVFECA